MYNIASNNEQAIKNFQPLHHLQEDTDALQVTSSNILLLGESCEVQISFDQQHNFVNISIGVLPLNNSQLEQPKTIEEAEGANLSFLECAMPVLKFQERKVYLDEPIVENVLSDFNIDIDVALSERVESVQQFDKMSVTERDNISQQTIMCPTNNLQIKKVQSQGDIRQRNIQARRQSSFDEMTYKNYKTKDKLLNKNKDDEKEVYKLVTKFARSSMFQENHLSQLCDYSRSAGREVVILSEGVRKQQKMTQSQFNDIKQVIVKDVYYSQTKIQSNQQQNRQAPRKIAMSDTRFHCEFLQKKITLQEKSQQQAIEIQNKTLVNFSRYVQPLTSSLVNQLQKAIANEKPDFGNFQS